MSRIPLVYALHSGSLYGTERMALRTAQALSDEFVTTIVAPPGPVHCEAERYGFRSVCIASARDFFWWLRGCFHRFQRFAFLATSVSHSAACLTWNALYRRKLAHLHIVHGGAEERLSYGRKRLLNRHPLTFIAVSEYVRDRLSSNGVTERKVRVIENFLASDAVALAPKRNLFNGGCLKRVAVISRLDPEKRVDLLVTALERHPDVLGTLSFHVYGTGWNQHELVERAERNRLNVRFEGFHTNVRTELAKADLLLHLCPVEPFGLVVLEAMAARVPVLVPDAGGAGSLVRPRVDGFHFKANDADSLAEAISSVCSLSPPTLNGVVLNAEQLLMSRFAERDRAADYRSLLLEHLN